MKKVITSIATLVIAGSVSAANESFIYHGFEENNPDLYSGYSAVETRTAVQPGVGDSSDRSRPSMVTISDSYGHWVKGNPDAYSGFSRAGQRTGMHPGIGDRYHAVSMQRKLDLLRSDSYDAWVEGNPDQWDGR